MSAAPRIFLEPLIVDKHLPDFHETWSDPANLIWSTETRRKTIDEIREWMIPRTHAYDPNVENYAIMLVAEGGRRCIGNCGVLPSGSLLMLGYGLKRSYWSKGYMSEVIPLLLQLYWARKPSVQQLHAQVNPENLPSVKILIKNGLIAQKILAGGVNLQMKGLKDPMLYKLDRPW
ncbi:hypothetical protein MMC26_006080 [Xylographa opegraphella]|nr:hypothetical protein [Xylographa opegraphella]